MESKKGKKLKLSDSDEDGSEKKKSKKKDKKRKAESEDEVKSDSSSELVDPEGSKSEKKSKSSKKVKLGVVDVVVDNPNAVSKFRISAPLREKLKEKGIEALFPIQAMTFDIVLDGADLVGRARTGQGKTLAFVLPILESLINGPAKSKRKINTGFYYVN